MGTNSLTSGLRGPSTLRFKDGTQILFNAPDFKLGGTVMGDRTIECVSSLVFHDAKNLLKAVVCLNTYKESGMFTKSVSGSRSGLEGFVYRVKAKDNGAPKFGKDQKLPESVKDIKDVEKQLSVISGSWLEAICFDGKPYWNIDQVSPLRQIPQTGDQS